MKNNKKLVVLAGAAALGLVAATGVTSGFAWFAVNTSVSATSLNVKAKTNASYLLINTSAAVADTATTEIAGVDPANAATGVVPVARNDSATTIGGVSLQAGEWYTATIKERDQVTGTYTNVTGEIEVGNDTYFVGYNFYLYLATGSEESLTDQTVTVTANFGTSHASVKAAVSVDGTNWSVLAAGVGNNTASFEHLTLKVPAATPTSGDFVHVAVELFIDGTVNGVMSATPLATLAGEIGLTFSI